MVVSLSAVVYRAIPLRFFASFASVEPLHAAGGGVAGSRFVPPQGPSAVYASLDADTAYREANQLFFQTAGVSAGQLLAQAGRLRPDALAVVAIHLSVSRLLDLRDPTTRQQLGIASAAEVLGPWCGVRRPPTQVLGETVFNDGFFEGILYPSAQSAARDCVVLFPGRFQPGTNANFVDGTARLAGRLG
jgi:RES domain-containing protein